MNNVTLRGTLYETPPLEAIVADRQAWVWLKVGGQWLPVLCRGSAFETVSNCPSDTELEVHGHLEYVNREQDGWSLKVVATSAIDLSPPGKSQTTKLKQPRRADQDDDWDYEDFYQEISPGFYWDPIDHEYVGNPDDIPDTLVAGDFEDF
jgi:hypothetical protein